MQLQKLDIIEKENARLRSLLSATPKIPERLLISEIINVDVDPYRQLVLLNKGSSSDVYQGQPVIDALGIFGQIVHVGPLSSTAILITDASHAMPVQIDRTGLRANVFGTGKIDQLELRYMTNNVDIQVGDMLISSGLGGTFPPNYPVATITKVERTAGEPFATIEAQPLAQLEKSREILLVWRNVPEQDIDTIEKDSDKDQKNNPDSTSEEDSPDTSNTADTDVEQSEEHEKTDGSEPVQDGDDSE